MSAASIRASDAEREAVTRLLQQAVADGRLTLAPSSRPW